MMIGTRALPCATMQVPIETSGWLLADLDALPTKIGAALLLGERRPIGLDTGGGRSSEELQYPRRHSSPQHRLVAIAIYSRELSIPTDFRRRFLATSIVVPVPQNGSRTIPSSGQVARIGILQRSSG